MMFDIKQTAQMAEETTQPLRGYDDFTVTLGDHMRGERATLGKSLQMVESELRIRATYLEAIENADLSAFETPGFIAGYVRSYARYLGLDPDWCFQEFCAETNFVPVNGLSKRALPPRVAHNPSKVSPPTPTQSPAVEPLQMSSSVFMLQEETLWTKTKANAPSLVSFCVLCLLVAGLGYGGYGLIERSSAGAGLPH